MRRSGGVGGSGEGGSKLGHGEFWLTARSSSPVGRHLGSVETPRFL